MLLAHLIIAHRIPSVPAIAGVGVVVLAIVRALPARSRIGLAAVVALAQVAGQGLLALLHAGPANAPATGCLPAFGRGAAIGLRLTLLRHDPGCPPGTLVPGPGATAAGAAMLAAGLILLGHTVVAVFAAVLVSAATAAVAAVRGLAALITVRTPSPVPGPPAPSALLARAGSDPLPPHRWIPRPSWVRGPPRLLARA